MKKITLLSLLTIIICVSLTNCAKKKDDPVPTTLTTIVTKPSITTALDKWWLNIITTKNSDGTLRTVKDRLNFQTNGIALENDSIFDNYSNSLSVTGSSSTFPYKITHENNHTYIWKYNINQFNGDTAFTSNLEVSYYNGKDTLILNTDIYVVVK
jgi:hypothetical protein